MILIIFVTEQKESVRNKLEKMFNNLDTGMTKSKYLTMCEQMGREPKENEIPPDWEDFPEVVVIAVNVFNMLGDKVFPEIGYIGKDYTNLTVLMSLHNIHDKEFFLEVLTWLDQRAIKKSSEQLKKEYDKLKRRNSGK